MRLPRSALVGLVLAFAGGGFVAAAASAQVPGLNGRIAFDRYTDGGVHSDIYAMNADGTGEVPLTTSDSLNFMPSFSPDGSKVAFYKYDGDGKIWVMNANGTDPVPLSGPNHDDFAPSFSPDGSKIAFARQDGAFGQYRVYVMGADGSDPIPLAAKVNDSSEYPSYSPDGSKIVFASWTKANNSASIYVMGADGSNPVNLTNSAASVSDFDPSFSPDGSRITFLRSVGGGPSQVYVMNADGSNRVPLAGLTDGSYANNPSFSPDGQQVLYSGGAVNRLHAFDLATGVDRVVGVGEGENGSWESVSRAPTCQSTTLQTVYGIAARVQLACSDPDGDPFSTALSSAPAHGVATVGAQGLLTFAPAAGFLGVDVLQVTATDRRGKSSVPAAVAIGVRPSTDIYVTPPPLKLTAVKLSSSKVTKRRKATLSYTLSAAAKVELVASSASKGRKAGKTCAKATRKNQRAKACTRYVSVARLKLSGKQGVNTTSIATTFAKRKLKPGRYRLAVTATPDAGKAQRKTLTFTVKK